MNAVINTIQLTMVSLLAIGTALADEKDFGTATPTEAEIIQHFKASVPNTQETPLSDDDYQDVSESDLRNVRGLKKINIVDKMVSEKTQTPAPKVEKAISLQVLFGYDSASLTPNAKAQLDPIGRALASGELKHLKFKIEGHTDVIGSDAYNLNLSRRRADSVKQHLIDQYGIAPSALEIDGKGETGLADPRNPTGEANRRVRIISLGKQ